MPYDPTLDLSRLSPLLTAIEDLRQEIEVLDIPAPLLRWLHRSVEARGAHMSTSIEGNPMTESEVRELFARPSSAATVAERENLDYRDATRFARAVAGDFSADVDTGLIRALHYLVVRSTYRYDAPAQWRTVQNRVADAAGRTVYMPPPPGEVAAAMDELVDWLRHQRNVLHPMLLAAIAHVEFVNIHPFDDGNGRCARALTTYFAERGGWSLRGLASSEAIFGINRSEYYRQLASQGDRFDRRQRDLTDWCAWMLRMFAIEAATAQGVVTRWQEFIAQRSGTLWAGQVGLGYMYLVLNREVSRSEYVQAVGVSPATAVKQLNLLIENLGGERIGAGRSTRYRLADDTGAEFADLARQDALARFGEPR